MAFSREPSGTSLTPREKKHRGSAAEPVWVWGRRETHPCSQLKQHPGPQGQPLDTTCGSHETIMKITLHLQSPARSPIVQQTRELSPLASASVPPPPLPCKLLEQP